MITTYVILTMVVCRHRSDSDSDWAPPSSQAKKRCHASTTAPERSAAIPSSSAESRAVSGSTVPPSSTATARKNLGPSPDSAPAVAPKARRRAPRSGTDGEEKWHDDADADEEPRLPDFQPKRAPGPQLVRTAEYSPLQLFQLFFSAPAVKSVVANTNKYAESRTRAGKKIPWSPLTVGEFYRFVGLIIHTALVQLECLSDYWSKKRGYGFEFPRSVMSRDRFLGISRNLHLSDPDEDAGRKGTPEYDGLFKIKPLYSEVLEACRTYFHPRRDLRVDERTVTSKARRGAKQYVKDTPTKRGYRLFVLADASNGYTSNFFVCEAKSTAATGKGLGCEIVTQLLDFSFLGRGYKVYMDSFYTSPTLLTDLLKERTVACGAIRAGRPGYPKTTVNDLPEDSERGAIRWYRRDKLLFVKWKDSGEVNLCSTIHRAYAGDRVERRTEGGDGVWRKVPVPVPAAVKDYNKFAGGGDLSDALSSYCQVPHETRKWYKTLFFHLVDIAVVNSFVLHGELARLHGKEALTQKQFRETLQLELVRGSKSSAQDDDGGGGGLEEPSGRSRRAAMCLPAFFSTDATCGRRACAMCKMADEKVKTPVYCTKCEVPLCHVPARNCFKDWHDQGHHETLLNTRREMHSLNAKVRTKPFSRRSGDAAVTEPETSALARFPPEPM